MVRGRKRYRLYRALLFLYPRTHRHEYGEQMVQTLEDMLAARESSTERIATWIRVGSELPLNIIEENISALGGIRMNKLSRTTKWATGGVVALIAGVIVLILLTPHGHPDYTARNLAYVPHAAKPPACLQTTKNPSLQVPDEEHTFIENNLASSITDVPAGTNVTAYIKTYDGKIATGSSVYSGKYGTYNFTAKKLHDNSVNDYVGGWKITALEVCKK
jgi:hypothetical protein